ncbi:excalibur calcium-binding domain-containing protein [Millisia brevis]|uniref:excalibur calcium-binding domain-containing protein n=1 Tax=Millisia brevis TaxID=264148 RepID=UPI000832B9FF
MHDAPTPPNPSPPVPGRLLGKIRTVAGWAVFIFGGLGLLTALFGPSGLGGVLIAAAFLAIGTALIWRIGSWKSMTPIALGLFVLGGITTPDQPVDTAETAVVAEAVATSSATATTTPASTTTAASSTTTPPVISSESAVVTTVPAVTETVVVAAEPVIETEVIYSTVYVPEPVPTQTPQYLPPAQLAAPPAESAPAAAAYYKNCAAARAAGAAPVHVGEPGYGTHLDRDGDGIGCER